jgi:hypothetical protein
MLYHMMIREVEACSGFVTNISYLKSFVDDYLKQNSIVLIV